MSSTSSTIWKASPALRPKVSSRATSSRVAPGIDAARDDADADERAGLGAMDGFDEFGRGLKVFAFDVEYLAADHAIDSAYGIGDKTDDLDGRGGRRVEPGQNFEGAGLQRVSGEDGNGFAEGHVAGGLAAAQVVVVERGQIVVDERIGVKHFDGCAEPLDASRQRPAMVTAACMASTGRSRLPPAKVEWRMAPWIDDGNRVARWE